MRPHAGSASSVRISPELSAIVPPFPDLRPNHPPNPTPATPSHSKCGACRLQLKRRGDADMIRWPQPSAVGFAMGTVPEEPCVDNLRVASGCGPVKDVVYALVV